jgi:hypothetical protein
MEVPPQGGHAPFRRHLVGNVLETLSVVNSIASSYIMIKEMLVQKGKSRSQGTH